MRESFPKFNPDAETKNPNEERHSTSKSPKVLESEPSGVEDKDRFKGVDKLTPEKLDALVALKVDVHDVAKKLEANYDWKYRGSEDSELYMRERIIQSLAHLILKMNDKLDDYDTLVSDDAGGRLVTLFMRRIINKKRAELDKGPIETRFVAGGKHGKASVHSAITELLKERPPSGKTLLVTDYIDSGQSIIELMDDLERAGVDLDLATVSIKNKPRKYSKKIRKNLFFGTIGEAGISFHGNRGSGVKKESAGDSSSPFPIKRDRPQSEIEQGRNDVKTLADVLYPLIQITEK